MRGVGTLVNGCGDGYNKKSETLELIILDDEAGFICLGVVSLISVQKWVLGSEQASAKKDW